MDNRKIQIIFEEIHHGILSSKHKAYELAVKVTEFNKMPEFFVRRTVQTDLTNIVYLVGQLLIETGKEMMEIEKRKRGRTNVKI